MSAIDTPDYQRGIVNAQKLLATEGPTSTGVTVGIPPNCETLVVAVEPGFSPVLVQCLGVLSGIQYPGVRLIYSYQANGGMVWLFDVSDVIDRELVLEWDGAPGAVWYVYSDAGVHATTDVGANRDRNGTQFVVPVVPYAATSYHPPQEVSLASFGANADVTLLAAPGVGFRYRIFGVTMATVAAGLVGIVYDPADLGALLQCAGVGNATTQLPAQGVPLTANGAVGYAIEAGGGSMYIALQYTTEAV